MSRARTRRTSGCWGSTSAGRSQLVLDLRGLTFMDSTGVRLILQAREHALRHGAELVVVRGDATVMRVLELIGLEAQLDFVDDV